MNDIVQRDEREVLWFSKHNGTSPISEEEVVFWAFILVVETDEKRI